MTTSSTSTVTDVQRHAFVHNGMEAYREHLTDKGFDPATGERLDAGWTQWVLEHINDGSIVRDPDGKSIRGAYRAYKQERTEAFCAKHEAMLRATPDEWIVPQEDATTVDAEAEQRKGRDEVIVAMGRNGMSVRQIADATKLGKSTVDRILKAAA